jgi:hypothetical protein
MSLGVPAFLSKQRLQLLSRPTEEAEGGGEGGSVRKSKGAATRWTPQPADDLEAAVLTFFSMASTACGSAPWSHWLFSPLDIVEQRATWIAENAGTLRTAANLIPTEVAPKAKEAALSFIDAVIGEQEEGGGRIRT